MRQKPHGVTYEEWQDWLADEADKEINWREFEETYGKDVVYG